MLPPTVKKVVDAECTCIVFEYLPEVMCIPVGGSIVLQRGSILCYVQSIYAMCHIITHFFLNVFEYCVGN